MSTAWKGSVVLLEEPAGEVWQRAGRRLVPALVLAGAGWFSPWAWLTVPLWIMAVPFVLLVVATFANRLRNHRVLLVHEASGAIVWPRSVQEVLLRREADWVAGAEVTVTKPPLTVVPGRADPRISLAAGERAVLRVPLYGEDPEAFVERANELLVGRGTVLRYVPPPPIDDGELEDSGADGDGADGDGADGDGAAGGRRAVEGD